MDSPINWIGGKSQSSKKIVELMPEHGCYVECVHPNSHIDVDNGITKRACTIKEGDMVLTHKGNYKEVKKVFTRDYDDDLILIYAKYTSNPLIVTPEHPVLTYQRSKYKCAWRNNYPRFSSYHKSCPYKIPRCGNSKKLKYVEAKYIEFGDYIVYPIPKRYDNIIESKKDKNQQTLEFMFGIKEKNDEKIISDKADYLHQWFLEQDFLELCGFYLAEGGVYNNRFVHFSFNLNEEEYIDFVVRTMKKYFDCNYDSNNREGTKSFYMRFYSAVACRFFDTFFGHGAENKFIHRSVMELSVSKLTHLIKTYLYGDGCFCQDKDLITATSVSYNLINQIKIILNRMGILVCYTYTSPEDINRRNSEYTKDETKALYGVNVISNYGAHTLNVWGANQCNRLFKLLNIDCEYRDTQEWFYGELDSDYMYMPVTNVEKIKYNGKVYNFEIEDDNSYVSNGFVVHNCFAGALWTLFRKPPSKDEVVNDVNTELVNFYRVIQRQCDKFKEREKYELYSRDLYYEYLQDFYSGKHHTLDNVERAFRYFYLIKAAFASKFGSGFAFGSNRQSPVAFFNEFKILDDVTKRLKNVTIDNRDFEDVIKSYDSERTLIFADPPYMKSDNADYYFKSVNASFGLHDYQRLYIALKDIKGKFILTVDDTEWIRARYCGDEFELLDNKLYYSKETGFYWLDNEVYYCSADKDNRRHEVELIILNYNPYKENKHTDIGQAKLDFSL